MRLRWDGRGKHDDGIRSLGVFHQFQAGDICEQRGAVSAILIANRTGSGMASSLKS